MELALEIILIVIVAPILEIVLLAISGVIENKRKWHPLKDKFDATISNSTDDTFIMMADADIKSTQIFALVCAILGFLFGIAFPIILYVSKQAETTVIIFAALLFQAIMLPMLFWALHSTTKKIYFSGNEILVKSIVYVKKINFNQINAVTETNINPAIVVLVITYNNTKQVKIKKTFGNYELAKKRFINVGLLK